MRVKICGTATFADLDCAVAAGADAVGFLMGITHVTQDAVTPETAAAMVATLPPFIVPVAVTHLTKPSDLIRIVELARCTTLQIQDVVTPDDIAEVREALPYLRIMKAVHVMGESAIATAKYFSDTADAILLDTRTADRIGCPPTCFHWAVPAQTGRKPRTQGRTAAVQSL